MLAEEENRRWTKGWGASGSELPWQSTEYRGNRGVWANVHLTETPFGGSSIHEFKASRQRFDGSHTHATSLSCKEAPHRPVCLASE